MANKTHLEIRQNGVQAWNKWRKQNPGVVPDLTGADLWGAELRDANLQNADFSEANLSQAELGGAHLRGAKLIHTNLEGADLTSADLVNANLNRANLRAAVLIDADLGGAILREADLTWADLIEAQLVQTDLTGADLTKCSMSLTVIGNTDLRNAKGLDTVEHFGPSIVGIDTIYQSEGKIPLNFLRGAGVPENLIEYMNSLVGNAVEYHSCFISYSSKDDQFAQRLHTDLQAKGVRCWFAPRDLKIGDKLRLSFDKAIRVHDKVMVVLSENSVKSQWVEKEIETAFEKERQDNRIVLFPIRLDDVVMETKESWAADIRRMRHIGDFRDWRNHDAYQKAFECLLRDLKAQGKAESAAQE